MSVDISGAWVVTQDTIIGKSTVTMTFTRTLTGGYEVAISDTTIKMEPTSVTLTGDRLEMQFNVTKPLPVHIWMELTVTDADTFGGIVRSRMLPPGKINGVRATAAAATTVREEAQTYKPILGERTLDRRDG